MLLLPLCPCLYHCSLFVLSAVVVSCLVFGVTVSLPRSFDRIGTHSAGSSLSNTMLRTALSRWPKRASAPLTRCFSACIETDASRAAAAAAPQGGVAGSGALLENVWRPEAWPSRDEIAADLAAAHVLSAHYGFTDTVWNHTSARVEAGKDEYLVTPFPVLFDEMTPELVAAHGAGSDNTTGHVIHGAVYEARPDVAAVVHTHTEAIEAVSCLEDGVTLIEQNGGGFYNKIAYHDWEGMSTDWNEQQLLAQSSTSTSTSDGKPHTLIMRNHGACTFGASVGQAWVRMYFLDVICRVLLRALSTGQQLRMPSQETLATTAAAYSLPEYAHGGSEWGALRRQAERLVLARREETARLQQFATRSKEEKKEKEEEAEKPPIQLSMRKFVVSSEAPHFPQQLRHADPSFPTPVPLSSTTLEGDSFEDATAAVAKEMRAAIDGQLLDKGALVFGGLQRWTEQPAAWSQLVSALGYPAMAYTGGTAARTVMADAVLTASDDPPQVSIDPHQEMSYAARYPGKLMFACKANDHRPQGGGETPMADMRAVTQRLMREEPELVEALMHKGVRYTRTLMAAVDAQHYGCVYNWENAFATFNGDQAAITEALHSQGYEVTWSDGRDPAAQTLRYSTTRPAFIQDPGRPDRPLYFNQITALHHTYYVDYPGSAALVRACTSPNDFPSNSAFGDGAEFDMEIIDKLRACIWECGVGVTWRSGTMAVLHNELVAHGRMGFTPGTQREIMVALGEPVEMNDEALWEQSQQWRREVAGKV